MEAWVELVGQTCKKVEEEERLVGHNLNQHQQCANNEKFFQPHQMGSQEVDAHSTALGVHLMDLLQDAV